MHLLFCHEIFYSAKRDGSVLTYGNFPYEFWQERFLNNFDTMTVIGRKKKLRADEQGVLQTSSGQNVQHVLMPDIYEPLKRLTKQGLMYRRIEEQVKRADALVVSGPIDYGVMAAHAARTHGIPYAVEMCGCAYDKEYFKGDLFNKAYAPIKYQRAKAMVKNADAVIYVTQNFLQKRYPTTGLSEHATNIEIPKAPPEILEKRLQKLAEKTGEISIGLIGNFENGLKGVHIAIEALGIVRKALQNKTDETGKTPSVRLRVLGQGIPALWTQALKQNGVENDVEFCGRIADKEDVLKWLDDIDIFIKPGFHEGLPRPLIEAMSRGCAALSSNTGETDDLLGTQYIHSRGDSKTLSDQILDLIKPENRRRAAVENFEKAKLYAKDETYKRREKFWNNFAQTAQDNLRRKQDKSGNRKVAS